MDLTQYIVVNSSIRSWPIGPIVAQGAHASVAVLHEHAEHENVKAYLSDLDRMTKVVLEVKSTEALLKLSSELVSANIPHRVWVEQPEDVPTALAIVPFPKQTLRPLLRKTRLMS
ncbi:MAG: hypothetical protein KVP17_005308 [Porospora cf. gigantea B]|uniref:uncharacterized protein n=1 Tax=Porospora cf. gigantea B TaxID=2853592 RepID=UPI003571ACF2|nr:MAG: hypothetical protein KVP17_005308 [Porospora cf. gigantea B]